METGPRTPGSTVRDSWRHTGDRERAIVWASRACQAAMGLIILAMGVLTLVTLSGSLTELRRAEALLAVANAYDQAVHAGAAAALHAANASRTGDLSEVEKMRVAIEHAFGHIEVVRTIGDEADRSFVDQLIRAYADDAARGEALVSGASVPLSDAGLNRVAGIAAFIQPVADERRDAASRHLAGFERRLEEQSLITLMSFAAGLPVVAGLFLTARHLERRDSARSAQLALMEAAAYTDSLTGLGNHRAFQEDLIAAATTASATDEAFLSVAIIDIDDFKEVNDGGGHAVGDQVLRSLAALIQATVEGARCYRIGGDEFALIMPGADHLAAGATVEALLDAVRRDSLPTISIGYASCRVGECSAQALRDEADAALYEAKHRGKDQAQFFDERLAAHRNATSAKMAELRRMIQERHILTAFQPIALVPSRRIFGYEALLRTPEEYGFSGPEEAFEVAAQMGLSRDLDRLCIAQALSDAKALPEDAQLFLNLHPSTLFHAEFSAVDLWCMVKAASIDPSRVTFEVTEQMAAPFEVIVPHIMRLRALGFAVALDDVGAGNSGLQMLRATHWDYIKIDRSIMLESAQEASRAVLLAITAFARATGGFVIAEGIDSEEVAESLRSAGPGTDYLVHAMQGYLIGRPQCRDRPPGRQALRAA